MEIRDVIKNVKVYGLEESVIASKYPMAVNVDGLNADITRQTYKLASCPVGSGHDQFLTGIVVQFDLTLSIKAWTEAERYHFLDFVSSQSTMHRIAKFNIAEQCNEYVTEEVLRCVERLRDEHNADPTEERYLRLLYNVPTGFCLTARMTTNYRQLKTIYHQRKSHRLPEWRVFCDWVLTLPYFREIVVQEENDGQ